LFSFGHLTANFPPSLGSGRTGREKIKLHLKNLKADMVSFKSTTTKEETMSAAEVYHQVKGLIRAHLDPQVDEAHWSG